MKLGDFVFLLLNGAMLLGVSLLFRQFKIDPVPFLIFFALFRIHENYRLMDLVGEHRDEPFPGARQHLEDQMRLLKEAASVDLPDDDHNFTPERARNCISTLQRQMHNVVWAYQQMQRPAVTDESSD